MAREAGAVWDAGGAAGRMTPAVTVCRPRIARWYEKEVNGHKGGMMRIWHEDSGKGRGPDPAGQAAMVYIDLLPCGRGSWSATWGAE
jgi:hypothetical protein